MPIAARHTATQRDRSERTRRRIVDSAIREFSAYGLAGARTEAIASAAKVNKALVYYYFKSKEALYAATIDDVMGSIVRATSVILKRKCGPGEQILRLALNHCDRIFTQNEYQRLFQHEMIRFHSGQDSVIPKIAGSAFGPLFKRIQEILQRGIRSGELVNQDWMQVFFSAYGANVFYAMSAPMVRIALGPKRFEPFARASLLARRRSAIQFLAHAIFTDRAYGERVARLVLDSVPLPETEPATRRRRSA